VGVGRRHEDVRTAWRQWLNVGSGGLKGGEGGHALPEEISLCCWNGVMVFVST
jgi:hypothetical protein